MSRLKANRPHRSQSKPSGEPWHGQETRPGVGGSEPPEAAASRAEGHAPVPLEKAVREAASTDEEPSRAPRGAADDADSAENAEEKREAAAEEHAAEPHRGHAHGTL